MSYQIVEVRDGEVDIVDQTDAFEEAIKSCLDMAEQNGFVPQIVSREELSATLKKSRRYTDGDVLIKIVRRKS